MNVPPTHPALVEFEGRRVNHVCSVIRRYADGTTDPLPIWTEHRTTAVAFDWGELNRGSAQLAQVILCDVIGPITAEALHRQFQANMIAVIKADSWRMTVEHVRAWIERCVQTGGGS